MEAIRWITVQTAQALHDYQIIEHGGSPGLRDLGLLEFALARPEHRHAYSGDDANPDIAALAAAYAFGIARNHCFIDGNKRAAMMVSFTFVEKNGWLVTAEEEDAYRVFLALGAGEIDEESLVEWFRKNISQLIVIERSERS